LNAGGAEKKGFECQEHIGPPPWPKKAFDEAKEHLMGIVEAGIRSARLRLDRAINHLGKRVKALKDEE